jgi:PhoPQ-activated pathogenicity-related protein
MWMLIALLLCTLAGAQESALDRYVHQKDPNYAWREVSVLPGSNYKTHVLELTSQAWRTREDVDRPVWKHWLSLIVPDRVVSTKALLFIGGGSNLDPVPGSVNQRSLRIALATQTIVADLGMVPNQPLRFTDSPAVARYEDDLIAYTRVKHFSTKDGAWLVRLAMVKSGISAMDAIQEFSRSRLVNQRVDQFVVSGGSKRGWTTWLIGATDKRVTAIAPTVIDALNSEAITRHHFEVYGFFSPALKDYVNHGLFPHRIGTPEYRAVLDIEDPFVYRNRPALRMPKLIMNASGDEFFLPDNSRYYYDDLAGEKHLRYVPNTRHNMRDTDATDTLLAFYQSVLGDSKRPHLTWSRQKDGSLLVRADSKPLEVNLWKAVNPGARDFRVDTIGKAYHSTPLKPRPDGAWLARLPKPAKGFAAYFVEAVFPGPGEVPFKFTTPVSVVPDTSPYKFADAAAKYPKP